MQDSTVAGKLSWIMLGAGLLAFVYVLITPTAVPDLVSWPEGVASGTIRWLRWLVGLVLGAFAMTAWYLVRGAIRQARAAH